MSRPPNVILIFCDDLGYGDLGCYGSTRNQTPCLDQMAAEGMRFTDFYVPAPLCSPSRAALLTGCYPARVGLADGHDFPVLMPGDPIGLNPRETALPALLRQSGYGTCLIGKWHLGDQEPFLPTRHGFDRYFGLPYSNDMQPDHFSNASYRFPPLPLLRDSAVIEVDPNQASLTDRYLREAVAYIAEQGDRPFFLMLSHMYVHVPIYAPHRYLHRAQNGPYGAAVEHLDAVTGAILRALRRQGIAEDTLVIFTSDNGSNGRDGGSNAPLRGIKGQTWEGGMRMPCLMHWPGTIPAGAVCSEVCSTIDLLPTLAALAGADTSALPPIDGHDITPLLTAAPGAATPHAAFAYYHRRSLNAVRAGDWKYHLQEKLLVNLRADIAETTDRSAEHPDIVAELKAHAARFAAELGDARAGITGAGCRPPGRVENPVTLTQPLPPDPWFSAEWD